MKKPNLTIMDVIGDPAVFADWFRDPTSWAAWQAFLSTLFGLSLSPEQQATFRQCTGRSAMPSAPFTEAWLICGRRAGKSFALALIAVFLACFREWRPYLQPGERAMVMIVAADRKQARSIFRYCKGLLKVPMLARLVERETAEIFDLKNGVTIEIATASYRRTRGYAICAALLDELAFWSTDDSAEPDVEVLNAIRPGMVQFQGQAMLLAASSPYGRRGALYNAFTCFYGRDDAPALVWKAPTRVMNPSVPQDLIDAETERDPARASAEYMAEFRTDVEAFLSREAVAACVEPGVRERKHVKRLRYFGFVDPSGGSADSFTLAIAHKEGDTAILDLVREVKPPFSPEAVVSEFCDTLRSYRIARVGGDKYGGEWPREQFRKYGVYYKPAAHTRSELYGALLPGINSRSVVLLDNDRLTNQLVALERRTTRGGRDAIDHPPGSHDDLANAAAGALQAAAAGTRSFAEEDDPDAEPEYSEPMADPLKAW